MFLKKTVTKNFVSINLYLKPSDSRCSLTSLKFTWIAIWSHQDQSYLETCRVWTVIWKVPYRHWRMRMQRENKWLFTEMQQYCWWLSVFVWRWISHDRGQSGYLPSPKMAMSLSVVYDSLCPCPTAHSHLISGFFPFPEGVPFFTGPGS